jgi:hypothetical protein
LRLDRARPSTLSLLPETGSRGVNGLARLPKS